ncbi:hypothetical protein C2869_05400 [Saccharobesus litoralis]|uniref:HTH gntR-type domain-containing protein n=1 Tax=Saccharobesus litoralis TaxID=2172099 RepID=A0A2S0VP00_9ALTE|nr:GntR family transcriptional regulator [Saccharobesus litoralis]AWB65912.1 hypothetical protein C2869_05400 [Saccharobesus litoralis]
MNAPVITSVRSQIATIIREEIISGAMAPGSKINEYQLAKKFGVSRGPVRDALLRLDKEGIVECKDNCGASVANTLDDSSRKLYSSLRISIEEQVIRANIKTIRATEIKQLADALTVIKQHYANQAFDDMTVSLIDFHRLIVGLEDTSDSINVWHLIVMRMYMNFEPTSINDEKLNQYELFIAGLKNKDLNQTLKALKNAIK